MNHLVTDVARVVAAERLRQADRTRDGRRLSRKPGSHPMTHITRRSAPVLLAAAVFLLALGSTATAAKLITGKQVKNGSITSVDLRDGSVTGQDLTDRSLTRDDLAELVVGPAGPVGDPGARGDEGPRGFPGESRLTYVVTPGVVPTNGRLTWVATCPSDTRVVGGGLSSGSPSRLLMKTSAPETDGTSWVVTAESSFSAPVTAYAWATCVATS